MNISLAVAGGIVMLGGMLWILRLIMSGKGDELPEDTDPLTRARYEEFHGTHIDGGGWSDTP